MHKPRPEAENDVSSSSSTKNTISFTVLPPQETLIPDAKGDSSSAEDGLNIIEGISVGTEGGFFSSPNIGPTNVQGSVCRVTNGVGSMRFP